MSGRWFPRAKHAMFVVITGFICFNTLPYGIIGIFISSFIFKSNLGVIYMAVYSTVPLPVVFAVIGIFFVNGLYMFFPSEDCLASVFCVICALPSSPGFIVTPLFWQALSWQFLLWQAEKSRCWIRTKKLYMLIPSFFL
jgi:hypothetical protein